MASAVYDVLGRHEATNLLVVSYCDSPDAWLRDWRRHVGELPEEVGFVHVGAETRSTATGSSSHAPLSSEASPSASDASGFGDGPTASDFGDGPTASDFGDGPTAVPPATAVSDPTDLARLGVRVSRYLETWDGNGNETVVYLDSLTSLLAVADRSQVFSFLHVLTGRVESVNGRCYYLLDPTVHDARALGVVRELADAVVSLEPGVQE